MITDPVVEQKDIFEGKLLFWKNKLKNAAPVQLPTDYSPLSLSTNSRSLVKFTLNQPLILVLNAFALKHSTTLFNILLATFKLLLYRYSSQEDICIGTPLEVKSEEADGSFFNTIALRTDLKGDMTFAELLQSVEATIAQARVYGQLPYEKVVEALRQEEDSNLGSLFQHMFVWQYVSESPQLGDLKNIQQIYPQQPSKINLTLQFIESAFGIEGIIEYSTDLYKRDTIERMAAHFQQLLQSIITIPDQNISLLPILSEAEKKQLLTEFNTSSITFPRNKTIIDLFESHAEATPHAVAVVYEGMQLTYQQLNEKANQVAHCLRSKGIQAEMLVPICIERSLETMIGLVGIMKSGAAYVPIDPAYPQERINYVLEDMKASVVVTSKTSCTKFLGMEGLELVIIDDEVLNSHPIHNLAMELLPQNLVYVIYTSGSTGKPKGVMIEHVQLLDHCYGMIEQSNLRSCKSFALTSPLVFDAGHSILHSCIILGGVLHILSDEVLMNGEKITAYLKDREVDCMKIVPSLWLSYIDEQRVALPGKVLVFGGEPFTTIMHSLLSKASYSGEVYNHYGPTETTIGKCIHRVDLTLAYLNIPIGKPFGNTQLYIVDRNFQPMPIGIPGELCIAGEGVGRGYLNRPALTAEKFVANPFTEDSSARMYRTGDLARWLPDGNIDCLGRVDDQVKIRGFRIELGEIESVLLQHEQVRQAVVVANADQLGNKRLVAYLIYDGDFDKEELVAYMKSKLPEYMVPSLWMQLDRLPLTFNGKVNKKALPEVEVTALQSKAYTAPRTQAEEGLARIWQRLLGIEKIGIEENFFTLGGHSLLAMRVMAAVRKELGCELSIRDLFAYPTIIQLASKLEKQPVQAVLQARERPELIPLSYSQQSLWFIHQLEGSVQYHTPLVWRMEGNLNEQALEMALHSIINRHEVLRTVIVEAGGQAYQKILNAHQWKLEVLDFNQFGNPVADQTLQQEISRLIKIPFDLSKDYMLRASLLKLNSSRNVLVLTLHHIASDGWSLSILTNELAALYESYMQDITWPLSPLPIQYADYALWQRDYLPEAMEQKLQYWKAKLKELTPLQLPTDMPRPAVQSKKGDSILFEIELSLVEQLQMLGKWQDMTLFMTLLAAFKVLLYRYSNQEDICVGTPVAGRDSVETEDLIGFFVNSLALRTQLSGEMSVAQLLDTVRTTALEAFQYAQVPFEKVVEAVVQERDLSRNPIFQHLFVLQNVPEASLHLAGLALTREKIPHHTSRFDLAFQLTETNNGIKGVVEYCTDLYTPDTIERMIGHYRQLLQSIVSNPAQSISTLPLLTTKEEKQLLEEFNHTTTEYANSQTILDMFEGYAEHMPDAISVVFENNEMTYGELNGQANQVAHYLKGKGVQAETLVPICMDRSLEMITGIIGILKAGAAYVPIDPTYPQERINYILDDTKASLVVCNRESKSLFTQNAVEIIDLTNGWIHIQQESVSNLSKRPAAHQLAYVIYTSGSTGKPKGVMIEHGSLAASTQARQSYYHKIESVLLIPSFAFDSSVAVIFGTLCTGGKLILCRSQTVKEPHHIKHLLQQTEAILCVPSYYRFLLEEKLILGSALSKVIVAGENLEETLVDMHFTLVPQVHLFNEYGPTECTVWASVAQLERHTSKVTIGKPINNTLVYIVGNQNQLNPIGIPGELCIAGEGVARGYLNRPELTAEKFVTNPFTEDSGARMYRTGDLARWLPDGNIEYIGRRDDQVKIRGFRIELGEIESMLLQYAQIRQAAVVAMADKLGNNRLVAFVVAESTFDREAIISFLKLKLPEHMVPRLWVKMEHLPLNSNGKVNKKALPAVDTSSIQTKHYEVSQTPVEELISGIWQDILGIEKVGRYDNFFELGGNSLLAMRVHMEVKRATGSILPLSAVFAYPKLMDFAIRLQTISENSKWDPLITIQPKGARTPIYFVHDAFGDIEYAYRLATFLGDQHPMYGLLALGTNGIDTPLNSMDALVDFHINRLLAHQPEGPYHLISYSLGGNLVHAMACRLAIMRKKVGLVVIFDAYPINHSRFTYRRIGLTYVLRSVANFLLSNNITFRYKCKTVFTEVPQLIRFNLFRIKSRLREEKVKGSQAIQKRIEPRERIFLGLKQATDNYKVQPFPGVVIFFRAKENTAKYLLNSDFGWKYYAEGGIHVYDLPGIHRAILREKSIIEYVAKTLDTHFNWFEQIRS